MAWPWMYGYRQYLPPDDLPEDFSEADWGDEDDDECLKLPAQEKRS